MIGAIADDVTGGTDVAVAFQRQGLRTLLFFATPSDDLTDLPEHDAIVIALKTRTVDPDEAIVETLTAAHWLQRRAPSSLYFKYCSTFDSTDRGNIGPVLDALTNLVGAERVVTTPSSPEHGRTQYQGYLFVHDRMLADSHMRDHPLTPMRDSHLPRLLGPQTRYTSTVIAHATTAQGGAAIRAAVDAQSATYVFVDALTDEDLLQIGQAVIGDPLLAGGAGLAGGLAAAIAEQSPLMQQRAAADYRASDDECTVVLAGSCAARTLEQIDVMQRHGHPSYRLDALAHPDADALAADALRWFDSLGTERAPLIYSSVSPGELERVHAALGVEGSSAILEGATATIATALVNRGVQRFIVAGGETSGAVIQALKIPGGVVGNEAARGVPWISTGSGIHVLLKSGNFGDPNLLVRAAV